MSIEPIWLLDKWLDFVQVVELCFIMSLLGSPLRYHKALMEIYKNATTNPNQKFHKHPFYDWLSTTQKLFDGEWQGGPEQRYSPVGIKDISTVFGTTDKSKATNKLLEVGMEWLENIVSLLISFLNWIDNFGKENDDNTINMLDLESKYSEVCAAIQRVIPCNFGHFRLGIFVTMANGCGLT